MFRNILRIILTLLLIVLCMFYIYVNFKRYHYVSRGSIKNKIESIIELSKLSKDRVHKYSKTIQNLEYNIKNISDKDSDTIVIDDINSVSVGLKSQLDEKTKLEQNKAQKKLLLVAEQYKDNGHFDLYEKKLIEGMSICPNHSIFPKKLAKYYAYINNNKKAISLLKRIIEDSSLDNEAIRQLGEIYVSQGEFAEAEKLVKKALSIANDRPKYYVSLTEISYNQNNIEDAISYMKKAIQLRPNNVHYLSAIAKLYENIGDNKIAKKYYFDVLEIEPNNTEAKKKINVL